MAELDKKPSGLRTHDGLPAVQNKDGTVSTEISITVEDDRLNKGKPTNIPSLWGGKVVPPREAIQKALDSGNKYPAFDSIEAAVKAAKERSAMKGKKPEKQKSPGKMPKPKKKPRPTTPLSPGY